MMPGKPRTFVGSTTVTVADMTCTHGQQSVTREISAVHGVESVAVDEAGYALRS